MKEKQSAGLLLFYEKTRRNPAISKEDIEIARKLFGEPYADSVRLFHTLWDLLLIHHFQFKGQYQIKPVRGVIQVRIQQFFQTFQPISQCVSVEIQFFGCGQRAAFIF